MDQFATTARTPETHLLVEMDQFGDGDRPMLGDQENRGCEAYQFHIGTITVSNSVAKKPPRLKDDSTILWTNA